MRSVAGALVRGMAAGAVASAAMSGFMRIAQALGCIGALPPRKITDAAIDASGADDAPPPTRSVAAALAHFGFGMACGALYGLAARSVLRVLPGPLAGAAFGTAVWGASYAGWIPALGILPPPDQDDPQRVATMVAGHWVYGSVLGALVPMRR